MPVFYFGKMPARHCEICGKPDKDKPMAFRGCRWCCDIHRKQVAEYDAMIGNTTKEESL
jgi:hypothetical protein